MLRRVLISLIPSLMLLAPVSAQRFELKPYKIKLTRDTADLFPELELRRRSSLPDQIAEPRYKSKAPQRFSTIFGGGDGLTVSFASDERKGPGKGFDSLFADIKGAGNLAKGKRLKGKPIRAGANSEDTLFPPFKVEIPGVEKETDYSVQARLVVSRTSPSDKTPRDSTLYLTSLCYLKGKVEIAGKQQRMVIFDANCNGLFGEKGSATRRSGAPSGDKVWIGSGSPKPEAAYLQALPIGKYFQFEGKYYDITVDPDHFVEIQEVDVPLGTIAVSNPGFLLELAEGDDVIHASNPEGTTLEIPVGDYGLITPGFRVKSKGATWELEGKTARPKGSFTVEAGQSVDIEVGPLLKLVVDSTTMNTSSGLVCSLKFDIEGSQGEQYKYLRKNGKKVELPKFSITDEKGREVKKGRFEYG